MDRYSDVVQNENGRAVPGASILILGPNGQPATIYADRQGTSLINPLTTDSLGRWSFCAADGLYTARVSFGGVIKAELRDIRLEDPDDGFASLARPTGATLIGMADGRTLQASYSALATTVAGLSNYTLPRATATMLGGVRIGSGLSIDANGIVSLNYSYTLPTASASVLGGIKIGSGLAIDGNGVASVSYSYTLPIASATTLGGIRIGGGLTIDGNGVVSAPYSYTLPIASATVLGGVKVGSGLAVAQDGTLSATGATTGSVASVNSIAPDGAGNVSLTADDIPEFALDPINRYFTSTRVRDTTLTGMVLTTNAAIVVTDKILVAFGKLQAQINAILTSLTGKQDTSAKDANNGYVGLTGYAINIKNAAGTALSKIASSATAARTYTLPDKDGTLATLADLSTSGAVNLLATTSITAGVVSVDYLTLFTTAYDKYIIEIQAVAISDAGGILALRFSNSSGAVISTAIYGQPIESGNSSATGGTTYLPLTAGTATVTTSTIEIRNANAVANQNGVHVGLMGNYLTTAATPARRVFLQEAYVNTTSRFSGFTIFSANGSALGAGIIRVYGVKNT